MALLSIEVLLTSAYALLLGLLGVYGAHRLALLRRFRWAPPPPCADPPAEAGDWPAVTVQLPLYNERTVAARLIRAVGNLRYPAERLEIQVLDDSTDETRAIADREVARLRERGIDACVLRRPGRDGFKAGALDYGLVRAQGELVCIFDADFTPEADFLEHMVLPFRDPGVGMVQARWGHVNREDSLLTRAQSALLDGHFVIEHKVRYDSGLFFNFNGTAGLWRRRAIEEAGGWQHDTLTEDLDLSYRAQLCGWRFVYAPAVVAPAEVPPDILAFKSQQRRWAKGSVQVARKLGRQILAAQVPLRVKLEAVAHLTGNTGYPLVLGLSVLLPLSMPYHRSIGSLAHLALFTLCTLSVVLFYDSSQRALGRSGRNRLRDVPAALSLGIGMCVSQTRAVLEGLLPGTGVFVRTPKRGDDPGQRRYRSALSGGLPGVELVLAAWFAWALYSAVQLGLWGTLPFLLLFFSGFAWVGTLSLGSWLRSVSGPSRSAKAAETGGP